MLQYLWHAEVKGVVTMWFVSNPCSILDPEPFAHLCAARRESSGELDVLRLSNFEWPDQYSALVNQKAG